jgi:membrane protease subunit (stomatin/prohibitin family)
VAGRVRRRQEQKWAEQGQEQTAGAPAPQEAPAAPDYTAELAKLAKLRDDGVITAEDFEAKKRQLLGI